MKYVVSSVILSAILFFGIVQIGFAEDSTLSLSEEKDLNETYSVLVSLLKEERFQEALPYFDIILKNDPDNVSILLNKGSVLIALDRSNESITYFDRLLKIEPENIKGLASKAAALANMGEAQKALDLYDKILSIDNDNEKIMKEKARLLSITPTVSIHGTVGEDNNESEYDIHLRVTVRNPEGGLVSVVESKSGRYLPVSFTDEVFDMLFEKESVEINGKKFEIARYSDSYTTDNDSIGNFFYEVTMNGYPIHVFEVFTPHVGVEPNDELYAEWTISRKVL